jgi:IS30 family transposase
MPHLKQEQIYCIITLHEQGMSLRKIAQAIGCHFSTVSRILTAVSPFQFDSKTKAEALLYRRAKCRNHRSPYKYKGELKSACETLLRQGRAPAEVVGRMKVLGLPTVSHETLYLAIYRDKSNKGDLYNFLPRRRKTRVSRSLKAKPRGKLSNPISIANRPPEAASPTQLGHFEADTVILKGHQGAILTLVDKYSKRLFTALLEDRTADRVQKALVRIVKRLPYRALTITVDNGKEFAQHELVTSQTGAQVYFCTPYSSWERGLNEQTNGLLRRYIPKKTSYHEVTQKQLNHYTLRINRTYKKCLLFKTPLEFELSALSLNTVAFQT